MIPSETHPQGSQGLWVPSHTTENLIIHKLSSSASGMAFHNGRTWFVERTLPGEHVDAKAVSRHTHVVNAVPKCIEQKNASRIEPLCPLYGQCGGCDLQHVDHHWQLNFKVQILESQLRHAIPNENWIMMPTLVNQPWGYRRRARLSVEFHQNQVIWGFFTPKSKEVVAVAHCPILSPNLNNLLAKLDQAKHLPHWQYIHSFEVLEASESALLLHLRKPMPTADQDTWRQYFEPHTQLWCQIGNSVSPLNPKSVLYETALPLPNGHTYHIPCSPGDFLQVNAELNRLMLAQALRWLGDLSTHCVWDLFSGLGNFTWALSGHARRVITVEGVATMVNRLEQMVVHYNLNHVSVFHRNLFESSAIEGLPAPVTVVMDPPRGGASNLCRVLPLTDAERILYVSCDPATLCRDLKCLTEGGFRVRQVGLIDFFPQSHHIETMVLLDR